MQSPISMEGSIFTDSHFRMQTSLGATILSTTPSDRGKVVITYKKTFNFVLYYINITWSK